MDALDFIQTGTAELSDDIVLQPIDAATAARALAIAETEYTHAETATTNALSAASDANTNSTESKNQSQQPYLEAMRAVGGKWTVPSGEVLNEALNADKAANFANNVGQLTLDFNGESFTKATEEQLKEMNRLASSSVLGNVMTNELDSAIQWSTPGPMNFGGSLITLNSMNSIQFKTPVLTEFSTASMRQSDQSFTMTSLDAKMTEESFEHTANSKIEVNTNKIGVSTANHKEVAGNMVHNAIETHQVIAEDTQIIANGTYQQQSANYSSNVTGDTVLRGGNMTIVTGSQSLTTGDDLETPGALGATSVAEDGTSTRTVVDSAGNVSTKTNIAPPSNDPDGGKWKENTSVVGTSRSKVNPVLKRAAGEVGGFTLINTKYSKITSGDSVDSTKKNSLNLVGENSATYVQGSAVLKSLIITQEATNEMQRTARSMIDKTGGIVTCMGLGQHRFGCRTIVNPSLVPPLASVPPLEVLEIPELPPLPKGVSARDIQNCIPEKFRTPPKDDVEEETDPKDNPEPINVPPIDERGDDKKPTPIPRGIEQGDPGTNLEEGQEANLGNANRPGNETPNNDSYNSVEEPRNVLMDGEGIADVYQKDIPDQDEPIHPTPADKAEDLPSDQNDSEDLSQVDGPTDYTSSTEEDLEKGNQIRRLVRKFVFKDLPANVDGIKDRLNRKTPIILRQQIDYTSGEIHPDEFNGDTVLADYISLRLYNSFYSDRSQRILNDLFNDYTDLKKDFETIYDIIVGQLEIENGGPFELVSGLVGNVVSSVKVVSNSVGDIDTRDPLKVLGGIGKIGGLIPGEVGDLIEGSASRIGGAASNILSGDILVAVEQLALRSPELADILSTVRNVYANRDLLPQALDSLTTVRLRNKIEQTIRAGEIVDLSDDELIDATSDRFTQIMMQVREDPDYKEDGFTGEVEGRIVQNLETAFPQISPGDITIVYKSSKEIFLSVLNNDFGTLIRNNQQSLENLLPYIVGEQNAALYFNLKSIYLKGSRIFNDVKDLLSQTRENINELKESWEPLYTAIKTIPYMVGIMNQYKMPLLAQVNTVLNCLDLLNKFKDVFDDVKKLVKTAKDFADPLRDTISTLEELFDIFRADETDSNELGIDESDADRFTTLEAEVNTDPPDVMSQITGGIVSGGIAPGKPRNDRPYGLLDDEPLTFPPATPGEIQERIRTGDKPIDDNAVQDVENRNNQDVVDPCGNVIFSANADKADSTNPADWADGTTKSEIIRLIETLPRMTQIFNSVKESPMDSAFSEDLSKEQILDIKTTTINVPTEACYLAPKLNMLESTLEIVDIRRQNIMFKMNNIDLLRFNGKGLMPVNGTIIQLYIEQFYNNKTAQTLSVFRTEEFFTPYVYNYVVTDFNEERNLGVAVAAPTVTSIHLQNVQGVIYSYGIGDVGSRLTPLVLDSYVVL